MEAFAAVLNTLHESVPHFVGGVAYYVAARAALTHWWMAGKDEAVLAKGRSWLISLALSSYLSLAGLYYAYFCIRTLSAGSSFIDFPVDHESAWGPMLDSRECARVMLALCALDLGIGVIDYPAQIGLLTGWVHHCIYIMLNVYILHVGHTFALMVFSCCEWPTLMLAVGSLHRPWRTDIAFGAVFFVTRIVFTGLLFVLVHLHDPVLLERIVATLIYPLHFFWFAEWVASYRRRLKNEASKEARVSAASTSN